jgi:hypothetical protein
MMIVVLIAGIGVLLAGLLAIVYGIPIKEFGFGNTLIVTGALGACTGVMMLVLWIVVRELKNAAEALGRTSLRGTRPAITSDSGDQRAAEGASAFGHEPAAETADGAQSLVQPLGQFRPRQGETVSRERLPENTIVAPEATPAAAQPKRNLLFSSSSRRERERAAARGAEPSMADLYPNGPEGESVDPPPLMFERSRSADAPRRGRTPLGDARPGAGRARRGPAAYHDTQIGRRRWNGLLAVFRRIDRGANARGHDAVRINRRTAGASRPAPLSASTSGGPR